MNIRTPRLLGDAYDDYMGSRFPASAPPATGFWSTVGNILSNRGVVQVQTQKSDTTMSYIVLGVVGIGMLYAASKA